MPAAAQLDGAAQRKVAQYVVIPFHALSAAMEAFYTPTVVSDASGACYNCLYTALALLAVSVYIVYVHTPKPVAKVCAWSRARVPACSLFLSILILTCFLFSSLLFSSFLLSLSSLRLFSSPLFAAPPLGPCDRLPPC